MLLKHLILEKVQKPMAEPKLGSIEELLPLLQTKYSKMWSHVLENADTFLDSEFTSGVIYRGMTKRKPGIYHPGSGIRQSQNTTNEYTSIMAQNPDNKGWPRRDKAFICTTSLDYAESYGTPHLIIPKNTSKIGIVLDEDLHALYFVFDVGQKNRYFSLPSINDILNEMFKHTNVDLKSLLKIKNDLLSDKMKSPDDFTQQINVYASNLSKDFSDIATMLKSDPDYIFNLIDKIIDATSFTKNPQKFSLQTTSQFIKNQDDEDTTLEVWIQDEVIVISLEDFKTYIQSQ